MKIIPCRFVRGVGLWLTAIILLSISSAFAQQQSANNQPLELRDLYKMMRERIGRDMTEPVLASYIERYGIAFDPTPDVVSRLRANGAHQGLINTIKRQAEKLSASAGRVEANGPAAPDPFIEETRKVVRDYLDELPDFICQQIIERYYDIEGRGAWDKADRLTYELTYNRKHESYKPINAVGRPITSPIEKTGGAISTGDFASELSALFEQETKTVFTPAGKERLGTHQTRLYDFRVPKDSSKLDVKAEGAPALIVGYSGTVWIDEQTKNVLRIDQAIDDLPNGYPMTNAERSIEYDVNKVKGLENDFLLPSRVEVMIADRKVKQYFRNLVYFKFYQKFETDIKISDDPTPVPPPKP
ncbi:MAG: hypothetical protein J2P41_15385 [Blastocatellia bacterium]|nr:hypothetical protein [Blastocatellia bacterium]